MQHRVGEEPDVGAAAPLADLSLNCVIRLASPKPVRQREHPGQLGVLGDVALHEQHGRARVDSAGDELRRGDPGPLAQHVRGRARP